MGALDNIKNKEHKTAGIPSAPTECMVFGCHNKAFLNIARVRNESGKMRCGAFSEFGYTKRVGDSVTHIMKNGYTFDSWVTRCPDCYLKDLNHAGRSQSPSLPDD